MDVQQLPVETKPKTKHLPWDLMIILGVMAAIFGYVLAYTTIFLAYRAGTLADVHPLCQNAFVLTEAHGQCTPINQYYTLSQLFLWGGVIVAIVGVAIRVIKK